ENGFLLAEINNTIKKLESWMEPKKVATNLMNLPSKSFIYTEPLGVVLIISPWNYPFQLLLTPLVGAMAAGNCVVLKSSEFAPATAAIMQKMISQTFDEKYISITQEDGATIIPAMMNNFSFDHVFYTGSTPVGKIIYEMAAKNLVPVTLELGGKSPCVVEKDVNVKVAARRIAMTKFSNAGQMCVAPDYILVHATIKDLFVQEIRNAVTEFYGPDASVNENYGKIINEKQFDRLSQYLQEGSVIQGGKTDRNKLYIEPTLLEHVDLNAKVMTDEIFGPVLPIIPFTEMNEALAIIEQHKNPLAFYVFTSNKQKEEQWLQSGAFGGGCVNNAALHLTNHQLPFGGRGFSGTGSYHGKFSFDTFSHKKSVMKTPLWFDPAMKYPPMKGKMKLLKWLIR
ncbi:MAG TPA: aldehyde dehydrogenase family protein, partial [Ferruginibacter sp.]|nr:aldehyde dehydrogenase family protein [Ferruginibacter sp.]